MTDVSGLKVPHSVAQLSALSGSKFRTSGLFRMQYSQSKLTDYYTYKYNHTPILKVNFLDEEPSEKLQKAESRIDNLLKEREKTLIQKNEIEQKFNLLKAEQKELQFQHKVIKEQHMKIQKLEQDLLYSKKKEALIGQELFVVGIEWHEEVLIKLNSKYHLKNVTCFSAIDQLNKLDALHNKIVVFSTSQASHQAFYKLKNNHSLQLIITNEQNPERVMRKVIESIEI